MADMQDNTALQDTSAQSAPVLTEQNGNVGIIRLNNPSALNALTLDMIRIISPALRQWEKDDSVQAIILEGEGDRAFCAGGDIKASYSHRIVDEKTGAISNEFTKDYFKEEYDLDLQIHEYSKPVIAFMKGITMGGGFGIAAPCPYRIVNEDSRFAMPEVGIGLFPDVGAIHILSSLPDKAGYFLALTGAIIGATDIMHCDLATHLVDKAKMDDLRQSLIKVCEGKSGDDVRAAIEDVLSAHESKSGAGIIAEHIDVIKSCFDADSVQDVIANLESTGDEWAQEQAEIIKTKSPTSLTLTMKYLKRYADKSYAEVLERDYVLSQHCMRHPDFYEGVRAQLVDKDKNPKWSPDNLDDVLMADIDRYFA